MSTDLSEFLDIFFEECFEGLEIIESGLIALDSGSTDPETINGIFRAAHSIKGGSATFQMSDVADFTHVMETLLDEMRDGRRPVTREAVDLLLASSDCLQAMITALRGGGTVDQDKVASIKAQLEAMLATAPGAETAEPTPTQEETASGDTASGDTASTDAPAESTPVTATRWEMDFTPQPNLYVTGNDPKHIFRTLADLGQMSVQADISKLPPLAELEPENCYLSWRIQLDTEATEADIREAFAWVEDLCDLNIRPTSAGGTPADAASPSGDEAIAKTPAESVPQAAAESPKPIGGSTSSPPESVGQSTSPSSSPPAGQPAPSSPPPQSRAAPTSSEPAKAKSPAARQSANQGAGGDGGSIRVSTAKVDGLINLVGELVITQSMLSRFAEGVEASELDALRDGLSALARNTRELQETAMQIRMLPISSSFNRFPRLVRDLSGQLGKKVELKITGGGTELDKTVLEKIGDPMVHLVRNSMDHGVESPEARKAAGKPEAGLLQLNAYHKGGNIVIEVIDDGAGLNTDRILAKARERGIVAADAELTEDQINNLIFQAGFSTAESVSDVSGRGVGMDVVRRNIQDLGGAVSVDSVQGKGSIFTIRLPLTLAILDGQLVRVGEHTYIISLISIVESLQANVDRLNVITGKSEVYQLRDQFIPVLRLHEIFNITPDSTQLEEGLLVVVESDGGRIGLFVDELLGQQQVVIKSLETNFEQVDCLSGATILGDGRVALIIDIPGLVNRLVGALGARLEAA